MPHVRPLIKARVRPEETFSLLLWFCSWKLINWISLLRLLRTPKKTRRTAKEDETLSDIIKLISITEEAEKSSWNFITAARRETLVVCFTVFLLCESRDETNSKALFIHDFWYFLRLLVVCWMSRCMHVSDDFFVNEKSSTWAGLGDSSNSSVVDLIKNLSARQKQATSRWPWLAFRGRWSITEKPTSRMWIKKLSSGIVSSSPTECWQVK